MIGPPSWISSLLLFSPWAGCRSRFCRAGVAKYLESDCTTCGPGPPSIVAQYPPANLPHHSWAADRRSLTGARPYFIENKAKNLPDLLGPSCRHAIVTSGRQEAAFAAVTSSCRPVRYPGAFLIDTANPYATMQHRNSIFQTKGAPSRQPGIARRLGPCGVRTFHSIQ